MMSAASSGGVFSSTRFVASTISIAASASASCISSDVTVMLCGKPVTRFRPRISICSRRPSSDTVATVVLTACAVRSPMMSLCVSLIERMMSWSKRSPATLIVSPHTISPIESTATSVVPPPISMTMCPAGIQMSIPAPTAATFGSTSRKTVFAPDFSPA